jgi:hypothetical protein
MDDKVRKLLIHSSVDPMTVPPFGKESLGSRDMTTKKFTLL